MNYKVYRDSFYGTIDRTNWIPDYRDVFPTLAEAKEVLLEELIDMRDAYAEAVRRVRDLRVADMVDLPNEN